MSKRHPVPLKTPLAIAKYEREKAERRALDMQALELRKNGKSFREIAEIQGCALPTATKRFHRAARNYMPEELVTAVRQMELDRFDGMTQINIDLLRRAYQAGDVDQVCKIEGVMLAIHDRRAKLIPIQVPQRLVVDATVETTPDRELSGFLAAEAERVAETIAYLNETAAE